ncbi:hypothetical protein L7F22_058410 [Adiantum nelumboides]|nr:hypothetical protein [Adiantum nelumboides]
MKIKGEDFVFKKHDEMVDHIPYVLGLDVYVKWDDAMLHSIESDGQLFVTSNDIMWCHVSIGEIMDMDAKNKKNGLPTGGCYALNQEDFGLEEIQHFVFDREHL